jgi:DNA repair exonuclease SbcCD ATPase subunit
MHLISAHIRNVRLHRDLRVEFDPSRNLVTGPNEAGKSTLAEAIHRALFLKARGSAEAHKKLHSDIHDGAPEVEVVFGLGHAVWTVHKVFKGPNGTVRLTGPDGTSLTGDEAEEHLSGLLGSNPVSGRLSDENLNAQWEHLWVWQGSSGESPAESLAPQQDRIVEELESLGGAGVLQSEMDRRTAETIQDAYDRVFTASGKIAAGSELNQAGGRLKRLEAEVREIEARQQTFQSDLESLASEQERLDQAQKQIPELEEEERRIKQRERKLAELDSQIRNLDEPLRQLNERVETLKHADLRVRELQKRIDKLKTDKAPLTEKQQKLVKDLKTLAETIRACRKAITRLNESVSGSRRRYQHWDNRQKLKERKKQAERTREAIGRLEDEEAQLNKEKARLAALEGVNGDWIEAIRNLTRRMDRAQTRVDHASTRIELLSEKSDVHLGDSPLAKGTPRTIRDATELRVGETRIRIAPGEGADLEEAARDLEDARSELKDRLGQHALSDARKAERLFEEWAGLNQSVRERSKRIADLKPGELRHRYEDEQKTIRELTAALDQETSEVASEPEGDPDTILSDLKDALSAQETELKEAESRRDYLLEEEQENRDLESKLRAKIAGIDSDLKVEQSRLDELLDNHGDSGKRTRALNEAKQALDGKTAQKHKLTEEKQDLQPEHLERDLQRNQEALKHLRSTVDEARQHGAQLRGRLERSGTEDLHASLDEAYGRMERAKREVARLQLEADAIRLLKEQFDQEQKALADKLSAPLAEALTGYVRTLFPRARAALEISAEGIQGIRLVRDDLASFDFEVLSEGTREQLAAAVRLASAEILARHHNGSLPVVFDDAFAYADPERVRELQRMLDHAAGQGLQIIVLTCQKNDYVTFPAKQVFLTRDLQPARRSHSAEPAAAPPSFESEESSPEIGHASVSDHQKHASSDNPLEDQIAFLEALRNEGGKAGNTKLREALGWDLAAYESVRNRLLEQGKLIKGRGRGGSVSLRDGRSVE